MSSTEDDQTGLPAATRPGAVTLMAADPAAQERFYREVLGLTVSSREEGVVTLGAGAEPLVRLLAGGAAPQPRSPGLYHLALRLPDRAALGAWLGHVVALGAPLQGAADHEVSEAIYLADAEGNGVEVYRDRPRDAWRVTAEGIHMVTEPLDAQGVAASATGDWQGAPAGTVMGHVHLQVGELARSRAFYEGVLGLPVTNAAFPGACFLGAGGYHHHLGLNTWEVSPGARRRAGGAGLAAFELLLPSAQDVELASARVARAGGEARAEGGAVTVTDPDGIRVMLRALS